MTHPRCEIASCGSSWYPPALLMHVMRIAMVRCPPQHQIIGGGGGRLAALPIAEGGRLTPNEWRRSFQGGPLVGLRGALPPPPPSHAEAGQWRPLTPPDRIH